MAVLLALALLAGGLHGVVMRGPTKPVCEMGSACSAPAPGVTLVFSRGSALAARVRSDRRGRYAVRLAPGTYEVAVVPVPRIGSGLQPRTVRVPASRSARVDFELDTGIR